MKEPSKWDENDLLLLIANQVKEGIDLDYKKSDYEKMTIEHLAPQNAAIPQSVPDVHIARLGNLILVDDSLNNKLDRKAFAAKRTVLTGPDSRVWVDPVIANATTWGEAEIDRRTELLANLSYHTIWKI